MPRITHRTPKPTRLSTYEELRNLTLAVSLREKQVKLRRLEWDTQKLALPHLTPLPGDGDLQVRKPLTDKDMPRPRAPAKMPAYEPGMPHEIFQLMMDLYLNEQREQERSNPYNHLASVTAQAILEAAHEREDKRRDAEKAREAKRMSREKPRG